MITAYLVGDTELILTAGSSRIDRGGPRPSGVPSVQNAGVDGVLGMQTLTTTVSGAGIWGFGTR